MVNTMPRVWTPYTLIVKWTMCQPVRVCFCSVKQHGPEFHVVFTGRLHEPLRQQSAADRSLDGWSRAPWCSSGLDPHGTHFGHFQRQSEGKPNLLHIYGPMTRVPEISAEKKPVTRTVLNRHENRACLFRYQKLIPEISVPNCMSDPPAPVALFVASRYALPGYGDRRVWVRSPGWPAHSVRLKRRMLWD